MQHDQSIWLHLALRIINASRMLQSRVLFRLCRSCNGVSASYTRRPDEKSSFISRLTTLDTRNYLSIALKPKISAFNWSNSQRCKAEQCVDWLYLRRLIETQAYWFLYFKDLKRLWDWCTCWFLSQWWEMGCGLKSSYIKCYYQAI